MQGRVIARCGHFHAGTPILEAGCWIRMSKIILNARSKIWEWHFFFCVEFFAINFV
jgi:hypothetical protein